jgi:hypothetical protein
MQVGALQSGHQPQGHVHRHEPVIAASHDQRGGGHFAQAMPDVPLSSEPADASIYREVRGLSRDPAVLRALNVMPGGIVELARMTQLHRTTVKRLRRGTRIDAILAARTPGRHRRAGARYGLCETRDPRDTAAGLAS